MTATFKVMHIRSDGQETTTRITLARYGVRGLLTLWRQRLRTRCQLAKLLERDPIRLENDLGLSLNAVQREIRKPFWQP